MRVKDQKDSTDSSIGAAAPPSTEEGRSEGGPIKRITGETRSLFDDLKAWVDLKIQLIQLDIEDRIRQAANQAALTAIVIVIGLLAFLFGLVAAGEALGAWFDSSSLGYLALAGALALVAVVIHLTKPRLVEPAATVKDRTDTPPALPEAAAAPPPATSDVTSDAGERVRHSKDSRPESVSEPLSEPLSAPLPQPSSDEHR